MHTAIAIPVWAQQVSSEDLSGILIWSAVLVGLVIVLAIVMVMAKRQTGTDPSRSAPFTLGELRKMRDAGQISDEEFQQTRQQLIGMAGGNVGGDRGSEQRNDSGGGVDADRPNTASDQPGGSGDDPSDDEQSGSDPGEAGRGH